MSIAHSEQMSTLFESSCGMVVPGDAISQPRLARAELSRPPIMAALWKSWFAMSASAALCSARIPVW
jgi:hypothetical protein